jgi:predicted nucleic acid-binding protein
VAAYFADTAFWIAISSRRDQYHSQATAWHQSVVRTASRIVTTEAVLWEWLNAFSDASTRTIAAEGYRRVHADKRIEVVPFQPEFSDAAIGLYRNRADKNWSLTDCLSFVVMERHALTEALTTDRHFEQAGFRANMLDHPGA